MTASLAIESARRAVRSSGAQLGDEYDAAATLSALVHTIDEEAHELGVHLRARIDALTRAIALCAYKAAPHNPDAARALIKSSNLLALGQLETLLALPVAKPPGGQGQ